MDKDQIKELATGILDLFESLEKEKLGLDGMVDLLARAIAATDDGKLRINPDGHDYGALYRAGAFSFVHDSNGLSIRWN